MNPRAADEYRPDTALDLGGYAFYPGFVEALRLRREITVASRALAGEADTAQTRRLRELKGREKQVLARIKKSDLSKPNQRLYEWHVRDALRME